MKLTPPGVYKLSKCISHKLLRRAEQASDYGGHDYISSSRVLFEHTQKALAILKGVLGSCHIGGMNERCMWANM